MKQIGGLTAMTKEEAQKIFGANEVVEINDALYQKISVLVCLSVGLYIQLKYENTAGGERMGIGKLSPDQRANLFHPIMELNLSESIKIF